MTRRIVTTNVARIPDLFPSMETNETHVIEIIPLIKIVIRIHPMNPNIISIDVIMKNFKTTLSNDCQNLLSV